MTPTARKFKFTPKQRQGIGLLAGPERNDQLEGGARSGKTFLIVRMMMKRGIDYPGLRQVSFRLRYNAAVKSLWMDTIPKVMELCFPGLAQSVTMNSSLTVIKFWNKSEYWVGGLDDKARLDKILGTEYGGIHFNETSQIPWSSVLTCRTRLAQKVEPAPGSAFKHPFIQKEYHDLNPVGKSHWSYKVFHQLRDPLSPGTTLDPKDHARMLMVPDDNKDNLDEAYLRQMAKMSPQMRARFFQGVYQDENPRALWRMSMLANAQHDEVLPATLPPMRRIVIGVDPSGSDGNVEENRTADDIGIVVCGLGLDDHGYVLEDATFNGSPAAWANRVKELRLKWGANLVIAEKNYGGAMVEAVLRNADRDSPVRLTNSSHGKALRAEPVSILYEHGLIYHCGPFDEMEEEMMAINPGDTSDDIKLTLGRSPNRLDAMVFAFTEIFNLKSGENIFDFYNRLAKTIEEEKRQANSGALVLPTQPKLDDLATNSTMQL